MKLISYDSYAALVADKPICVWSCVGFSLKSDGNSNLAVHTIVLSTTLLSMTVSDRLSSILITQYWSDCCHTLGTFRRSFYCVTLW